MQKKPDVADVITRQSVYSQHRQMQTWRFCRLWFLINAWKCHRIVAVFSSIGGAIACYDVANSEAFGLMEPELC